MLHGFPVSFGSLEFQAANGLGEDEGDAAEVSMAPNEDLFIFLVHFGAASVVFDVAKERGAILFVQMAVHQEFLRDFQDCREQTKHDMCYFFMNMAMEPLDLGVVFQHDGRMCPPVFLEELEHVVALPVITESGVLLDHPKRSVSIVISVFEVRAVLEFLFLGQFEDLFSQGELLVDLFLRKAEIDSVEETL